MRRIGTHSVWIGHAGDGRAFRDLFDAGIRAIVQLAAEEPSIAPPRELICFRIPLIDGAGNDPDLLDLAIRTLSTLIEKRIPTLVCCGAGMSRSPAMVAAALSRQTAVAFDECLRAVTESGPADLSPGLLSELNQCLLRGA